MTRIKDFAAAGSQTSRKRRISEMQGSGGGGVEECDGQGSNSTDPEELTALGLNAPPGRLHSCQVASVFLGRAWPIE